MLNVHAVAVGVYAVMRSCYGVAYHTSHALLQLFPHSWKLKLNTNIENMEQQPQHGKQDARGPQHVGTKCIIANATKR